MTMRAAAAWTLYWFGDLAWQYGADAWPGNYWEWPYRVYSWFMCTSERIQGDDTSGPWQDAEPHPPADGEGSKGRDK